MSASEIRHPTDEMLHAYALGELDRASAESVKDHLGWCFDCRRRVAGLASNRMGPVMSSTDGVSILATGPFGAPGPPAAGALPRGLDDLPDYEIVRELGRGGMGVVYLAQNTLLGRPEVLKVVGNHLINRPGVLDRFLAEIRNAAMLRHPNIVTAYAARQFGETLVLAMEYVEGLDLAKMVEARGPLPVAHACNYAHQAALGLHHAHDHGMVHRDIKPSNLMLARERDRALIKVLDFGLAKVRSERAIDGGLTHEGQMLGTPAYIAPEQISNARRADIRADIYSLGCALYCLLTGGPPFRGNSLYDVLRAHHSMEATPLNLKRPEVPVELAALVAKMMAKEPKRRFQEPKEVAQALAPFFKKGERAFQTTAAEVSCAGQSSSGWPIAGIISAPSQPALGDAEPGVWQNPVAVPAARETESKSPIDRREKERTRDETPAIAPTLRPRWLWPSVAGGIVLLALIGAWALVAAKREILPANAPSSANELASSPARGATNADRSQATAPSLVPRSPASAGPAAKSLFNGSDLRGWEFDKCDARMWQVEDRTLVAINPDGRGQGTRGRGRLLTERAFKEFVLRFEYQSEPDFNFAVVWWTLPGEMPLLFRPAASKLGLGTNRAGQRGVLKVSTSELKGGDAWNAIEVEARDRLIRVSVNGKETVRRVLHEKPAEPTALKATKPSGRFPRIGLDRRHGRVGFEVDKGGTGRFRNIEIDELAPSPMVQRPSPNPAVKVEEGLVEEPAVKLADLPKPRPTAPDSPPKPITNPIGMKLALIPAGSFRMGSPDSDPATRSDERPQHRVRITQPFYLGVTEVTREQFRRFVADAGYQTEAQSDGKGAYGWNEETASFEYSPRYSWQNTGFEQTDEHPVVNVSWNDAVAFAQWLSRKEGKSYRLPTEAEWEYACRAGTDTRFSNGDSQKGLAAVGNVKDRTAKENHPEWVTTIAARDGYVFTAPVGRFQPNALGLYDMHGNATEWCSDGYAADYYKRSPVDDPPGAVDASDRVTRGGGWYQLPTNNRSASRWHSAPGIRHTWLGFRVALAPSGR